MPQNPANLQNPQQNQQPNQQLNSQQVAPPAKKKKTKQSFALKPEHLQRPNGLQSLYEMTKKLNFDKLQDNVQSSMKQLTVILKTWHFQMLPRYSFDYFTQRCRIIGQKGQVQSYMSRVRKIHKGEDQWGMVQSKAPQTIQEGQQLLNNNENNYMNEEDPHKNEGTQEKIERAIKLINQIEQRDYTKEGVQQQQDESQDLFAQMQQKKRQKAQQKQKMQIQSKQNNNEQPLQQPYIPDGFQNNYDEQSYQ